MPLSNFDIPDFLAHVWQKKPLLVHNAFGDWDNPISAEELAGLALEDDIESRMVYCKDSLRNTAKRSDIGAIETIEIDHWQLKQGPFAERDFAKLDNRTWTLLVQAVDHYIPAVAQLRNDFSFIPAWLIDDIMVSYANQGASVGPHFDRYDVFLIQGAGKREWQIGKHCQPDQLNANQSGLSLLDRFVAEQRVELETGDMLYLPPGIAHWGIATDDHCMTYSVGFRTPLERELTSDYLAYLQEQSQLLGTAPVQFHQTAFNADLAGEIQQQHLDPLQALFSKKLGTAKQLTHWFGCWASQPKYETAFERCYDDLIAELNETPASKLDPNEKECTVNDASDWAAARTLIKAGDENRLIQKYAGSRFYCHSKNTSSAEIQLFINGREIDLDPLGVALTESVRNLCHHGSFTPLQLKPWLQHEKTAQILALLFESGQLYLEDR